MSWRIVGYVLKHSEAKNANRLVLIALASFANDAGYAWPGMAELTKVTKLRKSTVWTALRDLRSRQEIMLHDGPVPGRDYVVSSYTYRILVSKSDAAARETKPSLASESEPSPAVAASELSERRVSESARRVSDYSHPSRSHAASESSTKNRTVDEPVRNLNAEATRVRSRVSTGSDPRESQLTAGTTDVVGETWQSLEALRGTDALRPLLDAFDIGPEMGLLEGILNLPVRKQRSLGHKARWARRSSDTLHDEQLRLLAPEDSGGLHERR